MVQHSGAPRRVFIFRTGGNHEIRPKLLERNRHRSGMGGLACAAALARTGHAVLVVEQHHVAGGPHTTFTRSGFRCDVGVHYLGEMGPHGETRVTLDWLTVGRYSSTAWHRLRHHPFPGTSSLSLLGRRPPCNLNLRNDCRLHQAISIVLCRDRRSGKYCQRALTQRRCRVCSPGRRTLA